MHKVIGFVDGENIVLRYESMIADGKKSKRDVVHVPGLMVWHPEITMINHADITRISYYQTVVGDEVKIFKAKDEIRKAKYTFCPQLGNTNNLGSGELFPKIFKKGSKSSKTKSVDINLTIDMLRNVEDPKFDVLLLLSGDGDYLPLVEELSRKGKQIWLGAFSKGLNPALKHAADEFFDLDNVFFT